jgi:hypothetical protein
MPSSKQFGLGIKGPILSPVIHQVAGLEENEEVGLLILPD